MSFDWTPEELQKVVDENKIVIFMKGTPDQPQCGPGIEAIAPHGRVEFGRDGPQKEQGAHEVGQHHSDPEPQGSSVQGLCYRTSAWMQDGSDQDGMGP